MTKKDIVSFSIKLIIRSLFLWVMSLVIISCNTEPTSQNRTIENDYCNTLFCVNTEGYTLDTTSLSDIENQSLMILSDSLFLYNISLAISDIEPLKNNHSFSPQEKQAYRLQYGIKNVIIDTIFSTNHYYYEILKDSTTEEIGLARVLYETDGKSFFISIQPKFSLPDMSKINRTTYIEKANILSKKLHNY